MVDSFDENEAPANIEVWKEKLGQVMTILRAWREEGAVVNINCQMGKNRSGAACLVWLCSECGFSIEDAVDKCRGITAMACGNPHLLKAVAEYLKVDAELPLNPAADGGGWICISPPGTPRANAEKYQADIAAAAALKLGAIETCETTRKKGEQGDSDDGEETADLTMGCSKASATTTDTSPEQKSVQFFEDGCQIDLEFSSRMLV